MKKVIKEFKKLPDEVKEAIKKKYSEGGIVQDLITITNARGEMEGVLPFNTEDTAYLVRLPDEDIEELELEEEFAAEEDPFEE